ncbi:MAG: RNA polymerase sigma factor, sigma-70 family [Microgenomates group bacterium GW2011_GWA1_46_15]|nr:MAG: RNA polymerase sigma factor, sigma-70 family [Microgenomates group bacterium GW2011_GWB1_45_17]KKU23541.1 MAG: RNA polymerase sigma factor, sigma-70 family [Microgenomates group bacterium GW2011_GWA1_46_15]KKU24426.1 MAG: RNA polymerase sigma factor, sigma-70 family [Microgenomates group bacterium GW2011_GWC1_46_15]
MTENTLIFQLKKGSAQAVERWYAEYSKRLFRFVVLKVSNTHDAEEICHDTFLSCLESLPVFRENSSLWTWMCSVARHEIADYFRKRYAKKLLRMVPFSDAVLPESYLDMHETSDAVRAVLHALPIRDRELLILKYIDRLSVQNIASKLNMKFKAVESALFRARKAFQAVYAQQEENVEEK